MLSYRNLFLFLCFFLTACGFRPLYQDPCEGYDVAYPIKIATIPDRDGQILRNYLIDLLTPEGVTLKPKYVLDIELTDLVNDIGVRKDETTSRKRATFFAKITLKDSNQKIVYSHSVKAINSFSILNKKYYYSDMVAIDYAKKEALRLLAEKIQLVLSAFLDKQKECEDRGSK